MRTFLLATLRLATGCRAISLLAQPKGATMRLDELATLSGPSMSARGSAMVGLLRSPEIFPRKGNYYDKEKNPEGIIWMDTAENSLLTNELLERFNSHFHLTPSHLKYRRSLVSGYEKSTEDVLPAYFNAYFKPRIEIVPEHCVHADGIGSLLPQVIWALCEPGDGVLMATPYYHTYPRDIIYPAQAKVVAVHIPTLISPLSIDTIPYLRRELQNPENKVRVIILCNPHNPVAQAYPEKVIIEYAKLAEEFNVHLVVDEIYALQVFASSYVPTPPPFISIMSLEVQTLAGCDPSRIHVLGGPTKDFGSSGLKVGSLISQHNPDLLLLVKRAVQAAPMSSASDALFTDVLSDVEFRDWFLEENRALLSKAFELVGDWCTFHKLPFSPASAGVFFLVDLSPVLGRVSAENATEFEQTIAGFNAMQDAGVYLVPTTISEDSIVTRFRMTFTLPPEVMLLALRRIEMAFGLRHWKSKV